YPDINVATTYATSSQIPQLLLTQFQAGNAPHLVFVSPGNTSSTAVWPLAKANHLLPLAGQAWQTRIPKAMRGLPSYGGKYYGYPLAYYLYGVAYNKDQFQQLGLKVPTTFSDVLAMCKKITAAGKVPFVQGFQEFANASLFPAQRAAQYVYGPQPNWDTLRGQSKVSFASSP